MLGWDARCSIIPKGFGTAAGALEHKGNQRKNFPHTRIGARNLDLSQRTHVCKPARRECVDNHSNGGGRETKPPVCSHEGPK